MAVKIRLTRLGDKKAPFYRLVAADSRCARNGKVIENLGTYNPLTDPAQLNFKKERIQYWLSCGATPTDTARELLIKDGLLTAKPFVAPRPKKLPPAPKAKEEAQEGASVEQTVEADEVAAE